jgi:pilus assembly protein CpaB
MKKALPLIVAIALGLVAVLGVRNFLAKKDEESKLKWNTKKVLVAQQEVKAGQRLSGDMIAAREFPAKMLPENAVNPDDAEEIVNQPVNRDLYKGEPLLWSFLGGEEKEKSLSHGIRIEERAVTVSVNNISGVDGYVKPNDRVDIYVFMKVPTKKKQQIPTKDGGEPQTIEVDDTKTIAFLFLQNVTVLATGKSFHQSQLPSSQKTTAPSYNSITFAVTPTEVALLKFVSENGDLSLALRNPQDFSDVTDIEVVDMGTILDLTKLKEVQQARKNRVEVYRQGRQVKE